jgi:uncharacterized membrane protein YhaH (DUF805 family)
MTTSVFSVGTPPTTRQRVVLLAFVVWTAYVWASRIVNALGSDTESSGEKVFSVVLSLVLLALTVGVVAVVVRSWKAPLTAGGAKVLAAAAGVTIVVWLIRVPQILMTDHGPDVNGTAFNIVHTLLGAVSIGLAALVWQVARPALRSGGDGRR